MNEMYKYMMVQKKLNAARIKARQDPEYKELEEKIKELQSQKLETERRLTQKYYDEMNGS